MKTAYEFLKHFTGGMAIYPEGTSFEDIARFRNAIIQAMENYAKQEASGVRHSCLSEVWHKWHETKNFKISDFSQWLYEQANGEAQPN